MNELSFTFDEQMMTICLLANGWTHRMGEWRMGRAWDES